jgi:hypothetical protein
MPTHPSRMGLFTQQNHHGLLIPRRDDGWCAPFLGKQVKHGVKA